MLPERPAAVLALADGTIFRGYSVGAPTSATGEAVFNTAMTGYQEILTDPSYARQIVTFTCPHVGNVGVNPDDAESGRIQVAGLVMRELPLQMSNWRAVETLSDYLCREGVPALAGVDTRRLTRRLRDAGAQGACLVAAAAPGEAIDEERAVASAREFPGLLGCDLARVVSTTSEYRWVEGSWQPGTGFQPAGPTRFRVVAYDLGIKRNILRLLADRGCEVIVVPAQTSAAAALAHAPDGIFLSNGPGDPQPCDYVIAAAGEFIDRGIPLFGICLGHQILALASGGETRKMKFGHHGANHPVRDSEGGRVVITSQNHGFSVAEQPAPAGLRVTHTSLFDGSIQGLAHVDKPVISFQGHPEASPGPGDIGYLFDRFIALMERTGRHGA